MALHVYILNNELIAKSLRLYYFIFPVVPMSPTPIPGSTNILELGRHYLVLKLFKVILTNKLAAYAYAYYTLH